MKCDLQNVFNSLYFSANFVYWHLLIGKMVVCWFFWEIFILVVFLQCVNLSLQFNSESFCCTKWYKKGGNKVEGFSRVTSGDQPPSGWHVFRAAPSQFLMWHVQPLSRSMCPCPAGQSTTQAGGMMSTI